MKMGMTEYYRKNAGEFVAATQCVDMSDLRRRFIEALPKPGTGSARILDAGSGSGRDARAFGVAGYQVEAFDAAPAMVEATRNHASVRTFQMRFEDFAWDHPFEGIWACASLLHVASADLAGVFNQLAKHLVPKGVIYASFKLGTGERIKDGRRFTDMTSEGMATLLNRCPELEQIDLWQSKDHRPDRESEHWLNALVGKH